MKIFAVHSEVGKGLRKGGCGYHSVCQANKILEDVKMDVVEVHSPRKKGYDQAMVRGRSPQRVLRWVN